MAKLAKHIKKKSYDEYRLEIEKLDLLIEHEKDNCLKLSLIDKNITLNEEYIQKLLHPILVKKIFMFLFVIFYGISLAIFLPQIKVRKFKANKCKERIKKLQTLKEVLEYDFQKIDVNSKG